MPDLKSSVSFGSIFSGGQQMALGSEMGGHDTLHLEKALRMLGRLEALHTALALSGRLMRVFCSIVQVSVLPVSNARHHYSLSRAVASKLVRYHDTGPPTTGAQQLTKEAYRGDSITPGLHQNVDHGTVLIYRSP
jgi:hypothetical protein